MTMTRSRKKCPVCKTFKTYADIICKSCSKYFEVVEGKIQRKVKYALL